MSDLAPASAAHEPTESRRGQHRPTAAAPLLPFDPLTAQRLIGNRAVARRIQASSGERSRALARSIVDPAGVQRLAGNAAAQRLAGSTTIQRSPWTWLKKRIPAFFSSNDPVELPKMDDE